MLLYVFLTEDETASNKIILKINNSHPNTKMKSNNEREKNYPKKLQFFSDLTP